MVRLWIVSILLYSPNRIIITGVCTQVHGLTREDTDKAPVFSEVWKQIEPLIEGLPLVAHNAPFDKDACEHAL